MTQHLDEGTLRAHLDGELPPGEAAAVQRHLEDCTPCSVALAGLDQAATVTSGALALLPSVAPHANGALASVLARVGATPGPVARAPAAPSPSPLLPAPERRRPGGAPRLPGWMRLAAALVVGAVGVGASTIPGSPLREWVEGRGTPAPEAPEASATASMGSLGGEVAIFVAPENGGVRIDLAGLPAGEEVRLEWMDGETVGVRALDGARFETAPGRVHVVVGAGGVRIDVPRTLRSLAVWGNGERYLSGSAMNPELLGPNGLQRGDTVVFVVDSPSSSPPR